MTGPSLSPQTRLVEALVHLDKAEEQIEDDDEQLAVVLSKACEDIDWVMEELERTDQHQGIDRPSE